MRTPRRLYVCLLIASVLAGCGEFSYKRGASGADLNQDRAACAANGADKAAVDQCLQGKGWVVRPLEDMDPVAVIVPAKDNRTGEPMETAIASPATSGNRTSEQAPQPPAKKDPLDTFNISSWWKMGAGDAVLKGDTEQCVARLGEVHRPSASMQQATRGFLVCMREKGWYGLLAK